MKKLKYLALLILALGLWTAFVGFGFIEGYLLRPITSEHTTEAFIEAAKGKMEQEYVGNFAMALTEDGKVAESLFYSVDQPVHGNTVFPVASISKWVTSFGVMKLVQQGRIDLDKPIDEYLIRWHLPESDFNNNEVTVRRLLSHSAGLTDDLGYNGFPADQAIQTIEESLTQAADTEYSDGKAIVGYEPGSKYMYSGASYTLLQLMIEEVSGQSFQDYMRQEVLDPLDMTHSTFQYQADSTEKRAVVYKTDGTSRSMNRFTALAAAGLYTTTADLSKFLIANVTNNDILSPESIEAMSQAQSFRSNIGIHGLGPHLFSQNDTQSLIIGHDGSGNDAINTAARIDLKSKSGIVVLETGNWDLASSIADEWMFWKAGIADFVVMQRNKSYLLTLLIIGYITILLLYFLIMTRRRQNT